MRHLPRIAGGLAAIALSTLTSMSALAREPSPAWNDALAIEGQLGVGMPTGLAGLAVDGTPHPNISFNAGVGRGLHAMQIAAMARVRPFFITPGLAPGIGAGVSGGDTGTLKVMDFRELRFDQAIWLNAEVFLELRRGPFHLRPFVGYARRVHHSGCTYVDEQAHTSQPCSAIDPDVVAMLDDLRYILYTGVAVGFSVM
jgi:hypothetical protein